MKLVKSLSHFSTIHVGDVIVHPVFGNVRIDFINTIENNEIVKCEMLCSLLEFNNSLRTFDALDMIRIKYKRRTLLKLVR